MLICQQCRQATWHLFILILFEFSFIQSSGLFDTTLFQSSSYQIILKFILTYPFGFSNFNSNYLTIRHLPICIFSNLLSGSYYQSICFIKCERIIIFCATNVSTHILDYYFIFIFNGFFYLFLFSVPQIDHLISVYIGLLHYQHHLIFLFYIFILFQALSILGYYIISTI